MNLLGQTQSFLGWLRRVMRAFLRVRPGTTLMVVGALATAKITGLLAFFLPLKVIILAGSEGVPRYFQSFMDPAHKLEWIVGLSAAAFACYLATLALDALARRLARAGSAEILQGANEMVVVNNQGEVAQGYYARFSEVVAHLLFAGAGLLVILLLNPVLAAFLAAMLVAQYLFTTWIMRGDDVEPPRHKAYVQAHTGNYLKLLSSITFLTGFVVLLVPFLTGAGGNVIVAVLSILLLRQLLGSVVSAVNDGTRLAADRYRIDPLIFRDHQMERREEREQQTLRDLFHREARGQRTREALRQVDGLPGPAEIRWADSAIPGVATLHIVAPGTGEDGPRHFQQQIFPAGRLQQLEHEEYLLRHIPPKRLRAPRAHTRFPVGPFECRICDYGLGRPLTGAEWKDWRYKLLLNTLGCQPPATLAEAYGVSHALLPKRLNERLIDRLAVALDTDEEAEVLHRLLAHLPSIRARLQGLPLCIHNPDLAPGNTVPTADGDVLVMTWGRWTLEPLGVNLPSDFRELQALTQLIDKLRARREDIPGTLSPDDLLLAHRCRRLEEQVERGRYKAALREAAALARQAEA